MARRFRRGRRHGLPKSAGGWVSLAFKIFGGLVAAGPGINVTVNAVQKGNFQSLPNDLLFAYTGLGGSTPVNTQALATGIGSIAGGVLLAKIGSVLGRMIH